MHRNFYPVKVLALIISFWLFLLKILDKIVNDADEHDLDNGEQPKKKKQKKKHHRERKSSSSSDENQRPNKISNIRTKKGAYFVEYFSFSVTSLKKTKTLQTFEIPNNIIFLFCYFWKQCYWKKNFLVRLSFFSLLSGCYWHFNWINFYSKANFNVFLKK